MFATIVYIMSSIFKVVKDQFWAQFNFVLLQGSETVKNNDKDIELLIIYKYCQTIIDAEKKGIQDYYFDFANKKLVYKHV